MQSSNLLRQLTQFMDSRQQPINYETSNSKYLHHFIKVSTKVNDPLYLNLCEGMKKLFGIGEKGQVMQNLVEYLLDNHEDEVKAALREKKVIPRRMSVYETAVMMDKANLLGTNLRALTQCMMCFMDIDKRLWADENEIRELGSHCVLPIVDVYHHPVSDKEDALREKIRFWYKETAEMFVRSAQSLIDGIQDFDPKKVNFIHSCLGADHATKNVGKIRVVSKCIMNYDDNQYHVDMYSIADVECKKDSAAILKATVMPSVIDGLNAITTGKVIFTENEDQPGK